MHKLNLTFYFILFCFVSCNNYWQTDMIGEWYNKEENCKIILLADSTFHAVNLPLDVENSYCLIKKDNFTYSGKGFWSANGNNIKLNFNKFEWYTLSISSANNLYIKLSEEVGGEVILFDKLK